MAFNVRIFGYAGLTRMRVLNQSQFSSDSVFQLAAPYLWSQMLVTNGTTPVSSTAPTLPAGQTIDNTDILRIEIPDGDAIRYEVNPPNRNVAASANSPILQGLNQIKFGVGWTISIIDASGT